MDTMRCWLVELDDGSKLTVWAATAQEAIILAREIAAECA
jgi:hypothetical protein